MQEIWRVPAHWIYNGNTEVNDTTVTIPSDTPGWNITAKLKMLWTLDNYHYCLGLIADEPTIVEAKE